eukprot:CAMPEP_0204065804 /NCGR_PEP_ID=MMETSP0360-20130528/150849_1 /ASSEMBLY_ACC=CAM_ASM_000342 /TAXON_ID=268821 /ORGANISM="Scrippsiella Hangoei, Strain SHTV-5" /LENGTH=36 /DNA_ID= /DNA_START= /DNA_END= /DNA_ORIENTATION=
MTPRTLHAGPPSAKASEGSARNMKAGQRLRRARTNK